MAFLDFVMDYVVPVAGGVFILIFLSIFGYVIHRMVLKPLGFYTALKNFMFSMRKNKLLKDEKILEYCIIRIEKNHTQAQVREELLLANKYISKKIDEIIYVFNTVKSEMNAGQQKVEEDLP